MSRFLESISFLFFYVKEVVISNVRVAHDVLTPRHRMTPGIISVNIDDMTDRQKLFMANLITMTPGTLGLAVSQDRRTLYIHCMYIDNSPERLAKELEEDYGRRVRRVF